MKRQTLGACAAVVLLLALAPFLTPYFSGLLLTAIAFAILGISVNLVYGYLGYLSFGHAAFFGLGAYTAGLLYAKVGLPFIVAALLGLVPPVVLGVLVGFASLRVSGAYFAIATLASAEILRLVATSWVSLTRGPMGTVIPAPELEFVEKFGLELYQYHLMAAIAILALVVFLVRRLLRSPVGRSWLAIRESIDLAESVGIPTLRIKVINIAISGGLAGLAGILLVPKVLVLSPDLFNASYSAIGLLIVILGGRGTLLGALIGGVIFAVLPETLHALDEYRMIVFAALLLIAVRTQSKGIVGLLEPMLRRLRGWLPAPPADAQLRAAANGTSLTLQRASSSAAQGQPMLQVVDLEKRFSGVRAVDGSNFSVAHGEIFGIIGPNGAGKTTLLNMISGFLSPTAGTVRTLGVSTAGLAPHELARMGVVRTFQHTELYRGLTVAENVMIGTYLVETSSLWQCIAQGSTFRDAERRRRGVARQVLQLVGLQEQGDALADALSYGDQKLLSIALALAAGPSLLLLDEPAAGLNHSEADRLRSTLQLLRTEGLTIALVDHNLQLMMSTCDRLLAVNYGVPLTIGTPQQVADNAAVREAYLG